MRDVSESGLANHKLPNPKLWANLVPKL